MLRTWDSLFIFQVITEERGLNLDKVQVDMLGNAKKVSVIRIYMHLHALFLSTERIDMLGAGHCFS